MKRIQVDTATFKVLKKTVPAGIDVSNAGPDDLAFNGFSSSYAGVLFSGVENSTDGTWSTSAVSGWVIGANGFQNDYQGSNRIYKRISFASKGVTQTLTQAPDVVIMLQRVGSTGAGATPSYSYVQQSGTAASDWAGGAVWASTTTTDLLIRIDKNRDLANNMPTDWKVAYVVFQTFIGLPGLTPG
jgi:hypothetical protein